MLDVSRECPTQWISDTIALQTTHGSQVVGLISGNRSLNDTRTIVTLARQFCKLATEGAVDPRVLLCRLNIFDSNEVERLDEQPSGLPPAARSPLGNWKEVTVPVPIGTMASWSLLHLPSWIAAWRKSFGFVLVDVGPANLVPARIIGRLCNTNFLVLGPKSSGSHEWLLSHIDWLRASGVTLSGSLLASLVLDQKAA